MVTSSVPSEALELRGSGDFADLAAYQAFLAETVARKNARRAAAVAIELKALQPLPRHPADFSLATVGVTRFGTIMARGVLYSVPSPPHRHQAEGPHL